MKTGRLCGLASLALMLGFCGDLSGQDSRYERQRKMMVDRLAAVESQLESSRARLIKEKASVEMNEAKLQKLYDRQDKERVSNDAFPEVIKSLQAQRVELMIDLAGMEARRKMIVELSAKGNPKKTEVMEQLKALLVLEEDAYKRAEMMHDRAQISRNELQKQKAKLLELKIRMAEAGEAPSESSLFEGELVSASLDRAQKRAMLDKIEEILDEMVSARKLLEETTAVKKAIEDSKSQIKRLNGSLARYEVEIKQYRTMIEDIQKNIKEK